MSSARKKAYIAMLGVILFWGAALPIVKPALSFTTPFRFLFYRYLFAAPLALPFLIYYLTFRFRPKLRDIITIIGVETIGLTIDLSLLYEGLRRTSALDAALITATAPLFVVIFGIVFLKEREEKREWLGLALAFAGTILLTGIPLFNGFAHSSGTFAGNFLIIIRNLMTATYTTLAKRHYQHIPKPFVTTISFWVGLGSFAFLVWLTTPSFMLADLAMPKVLFASFYMATFGSIVAATLYLYGHSQIEISEATLFTYLESVVAIPLAVIFLGDRMSPLSWVAIVIIILGVYLAERRGKSYNKSLFGKYVLLRKFSSSSETRKNDEAVSEARYSKEE